MHDIASVAALMRFHARHKLLLMAHSPAAYRALGRVVAEATPADLAERVAAYRAEFEAALAQPATRGRHVNALQHAAGYFKRIATEDEQRNLAAVIADYERGAVPLDGPLTLVRDRARQYQVQYLLDQVYLAPEAGAPSQSG